MKRPERDSGFSLPEMLIVGSLITILVLFISPIVAERARMAKVRTCAAQFALDVRAARWVAVSNRSSVDMTFDVDANEYTYEDAHGRTRKIVLPDGVEIVSSTSPIQFLSNGAVPGGATTVMEIDMGSGTMSRWTISTNPLGVPTTTHKKVAS